MTPPNESERLPDWAMDDALRVMEEMPARGNYSSLMLQEAFARALVQTRKNALGEAANRMEKVSNWVSRVPSFLLKPGEKPEMYCPMADEIRALIREQGGGG